MSVIKNVLGTNLRPCSTDPMTGYYRDGYCNCGPEDPGKHLVCALMDAEFLSYSKQRGNDLSTPRPEFGFNGLKPGDQWCLCLARWVEAHQDGHAPQIDLEATHADVLDYVPIETLRQYAMASKTEHM